MRRFPHAEPLRVGHPQQSVATFLLAGRQQFQGDSAIMKEALLSGGRELGGRVRRLKPRLGLVLVVALAGAAPLACGGGGGGAGSGGAGGGGNSGGPGSGGSAATGGSGAKGGATGTGGAAGAPGTGGTTGSGGSAAGAGGATGTGGAAGAPGTGGTTGSGGSAAGAGGATGTGGSGPGAGGMAGAIGTGGAAGAAGATGTGGAAGAAGTTGSGGAAGAGGTGTGGAAGAAGTTGMGGAAGAAGTTGSGGAAGTGGTTVTPGVWSNPVVLAKGASWAKVILDGSGNAMLLYAIHPASDAQGAVFSRAFSASAGWQTSQSLLLCQGCGLLKPSGGLSLGVNIDADMNGAGLAALAFIDTFSGSTVTVDARRYDGHAWEAANSVFSSTSTLPSATANLHVDVSPDGTAHVITDVTDYYKPSSAAATDAWTTSATNLLSDSNFGSSFDTQGNGFVAANTTGTTTAYVGRFVSAAPAGWLGLQAVGTASAATVARVAAFPGQKGMLAWTDAGQVDYSTFTIAAGWAKQSTVGTLVSTAVSDLQVASDSTSAVLTWLQAVGSVNNVYSSVYNGSAWTTPALVSDGSHTAVDGAGHTPVGIDGQGNAFSIWFQGASTQPDIMFSRYASGSGTWSTPSKIATATGTVGYLQIAVSANGVAVVAWSVGNVVYASVFETTAPTGTGTGGSGGSGTGGTSGAGGGPGPNLITNGDFSSGLAPWHLVNNSSMTSTINDTVQNGQLCVNQASNQSITIGWPDGSIPGLSLAPNTTYLVSYDASYTGAQSQASINMNTTFSGAFATDVFTSTYQPLAHLFTTGTPGPTGVGVAFNLPGGMVGNFCVGNVSFVAEGNSSQIGAAGGPLGPNLIANGDFSNGQTGWTVTPSSAFVSATGGAMCLDGQGVASTPDPAGVRRQLPAQLRRVSDLPRERQHDRCPVRPRREPFRLRLPRFGRGGEREQLVCAHLHLLRLRFRSRPAAEAERRRRHVLQQPVARPDSSRPERRRHAAGGGGAAAGARGADMTPSFGISVSTSGRSSSIRLTKRISISLRGCSGMSMTSLRLRSGRMTRLMPARCAARNFSLMPPTGSTRPRSVISPVIATSLRIGLLVSSDAIDDEHGDARRRAVLGDGARRDVDVDVGLLEEVLLEAQPAWRARG